MNRTLSSLALASGLLAGGQAIAGELLHWQNNSLTYLYGQDFKIDPEIQQTVTFEHALPWPSAYFAVGYRRAAVMARARLTSAVRPQRSTITSR